MARLLLLAVLSVGLGGCGVTAVVGAAASVVGAAVDVTGSVVSGTVDVVSSGVSGAIDLATSDDKDDKEEKTGDRIASFEAVETVPVSVSILPMQGSGIP
jgi:hypothetical protein